MQNQRHFSWIFWTLRKHSFLSLALDIYSFRLKLLSPEVLECLCDRISHSEPSVFQFLSFSVYCVIIPFLGHISISVSNFLQVFFITFDSDRFFKLLRSLSFAQDYQHLILDFSSSQMVIFPVIHLLHFYDLLSLTLAHSFIYSFSHLTDIY